MKKNIILIIMMVFLLSSCESKEIEVDYSVFTNVVYSYEESESIEDEIYGVYYYNSKDQTSNDLYEIFYDLYKDFNTFNIYVLDTIDLDKTTSSFGEYIDEPILYLIRNNEVVKTFTTLDGINEFFESYSTLDYSLFNDNYVYNLDESLIVSDNFHFEYYYSETCSHCRLVKPNLLYFFLLNEDIEVYLFDLDILGWGVTIEGFLGTPTLYAIKDNKVIATYIGAVEIQTFIDGFNDGTITFD